MLRCLFPKLLCSSKICFCSQNYQVRNFWNPKKCEEKLYEKIQEDSDRQSKALKLPDSWSQPKVVIIGAGIAGLSAAHRLVQSGINDVKILEASDRPGGRIHSCWFNMNVAELGASTIKGACVANSMYNLAVMERILKSPVVKETSSKGLFYTSCGKPLDIAISKKACATFRHIERKAMAMYESENCPEWPNLEIFMSTHISEELMNFTEPEREDALAVMHVCLTSLKEKTGASLDCINSKFYGSLSALPGGNIKIPVGFVGILAHLIRELPDGSIKYCKTVERVRWDVCEADEPRACVQCTNNEFFPADYVIITTPLGFLKSKAQSFFVPNLPAKKMSAIKSLGFGHLNNLFIQFPEPVCLKDQGDIFFAWHRDDCAHLDSWVKGLTSLKVVDDNGLVLTGVIAGKEAITLEQLDADQIKTDIQKLLQCFLGSPFIPKPSNILRSKWSTDDLTQGAFTYISTDSELSQIKDLANPIPGPCESETPILFFAGEHTCSNNYATVHGARDSGIREADRIINCTKELKGAPSKQQQN